MYLNIKLHHLIESIKTVKKNVNRNRGDSYTRNMGYEFFPLNINLGIFFPFGNLTYQFFLSSFYPLEIYYFIFDTYK